jgi:hypothetical protein
MPGRLCRPADANPHAVGSINGVANQDGGRNRQHTGPRVSTGIFSARASRPTARWQKVCGVYVGANRL